MSLSFMTVLAPRDWIEDVGGWRCEPLKIPGARVDALYAHNERLDPACYHVDPEEGVIRWARDSAHPRQTTASLVLDKPLVVQDVGVGWKRLQIVIPVVVALTTAVASLVTHTLEQRETPAVSTTHEVIPKAVNYSITGDIDLENGQLDKDKVQFWVRPPIFTIDPNGHFEGKVLLLVNEKGQFVDPPRLWIFSNRPGHSEPVVYVGNQGETAPDGVPDYQISVSHDPPIVHLGKKIAFPALSEGFSGAQVARPLSDDGR